LELKNIYLAKFHYMCKQCMILVTGTNLFCL